MLNLRFKNYTNNIVKLDFLTKFNVINNLNQGQIKKIILNFSFKPINFNKKKIIPFLMALELIVGQKSKLTRSKKALMTLKIREGAIVGCKVTLSKDNLYQFYDYLLIALPRSENFQGIKQTAINKSNANIISFALKDLFTFYQVELDLHPIIQYLDMTIIFNTQNIDEKTFLLSAYKLPIITK